MFDFHTTLESAINYEKEANYPLAAFHYWLINFAFGNEEFPYSYTPEIGSKGQNGFLKMMKKHKNEILTSDSYLQYQKELSCFPSYTKYFENFDRVVLSFINKSKR